MINKVFVVINIAIFFAIMIIPFYTEIKLLNLFLSYIASFVWCLMIGMIGIKSGIAIFLTGLYLTISFVYQSFEIDFNAIFGSLLGVIGALLLYFSRGMHLE